MTTSCATHLITTPSGGVPNNPLPLMLYPGVAAQHKGDFADWFEQRFDSHGWPPRWRYPVFTYTHFHSNTHEVLGIYQGSAEIQFGGEDGPVIHIAKGDAVLIPAGVGHKQIAASKDFMAVGAYPEGFSPDKCLDQPENLALTQRHVTAVPCPDTDPLFGTEGGILLYWTSSGTQ